MASRFWVGGAGTWDGSTTTHWASTTGGTAGASAPTSVDDVTFDSGSGITNGITITIASGAVCHNWTATGPAVASFIFSLSANFPPGGSVSIVGNSTVNRILIASSAAGTARTLTIGTLTALTNVDFMDISAAGAAAPLSGTSIGDALGNTSITFTANPGTSNGGNGVNRYWVATAGGSWNATSSWSTTDGGSSGATVPLPQDDVFFTVNSITASGKTITVNIARAARNVDLSGVANTPTVSFTANATFYGNWTGGVHTASGTNTQTLRGRSLNTFTSAGVSWSMGWTVTNPGGTYTLGDNFTSTISPATTTALVVNAAGTFDAGGHNVALTSFFCQTATATINMGSGTWTITGSLNTSNNAIWTVSSATLNATAATIVLSDTGTNAKTFAGGGKAYGLLSIAGGGTGAITITGSNTFATLLLGPPKTVIFTAGTTTTAAIINATGSSGNVITFQSSAAGTPYTISSSHRVSCDWISVKDSTAAGSIPFYAGPDSTLVSGTTNWVLTYPPSFTAPPSQAVTRAAVR